MTPHPTDRDWDRLDALVDEDPIALRDAAWRLTTALAAEEAELDSWMTRAYEAEGKLWKAEARIKAVQRLIDQADEMGEWAITCTRLQWAIDGSAPQPGA